MQGTTFMDLVPDMHREIFARCDVPDGFQMLIICRQLWNEIRDDPIFLKYKHGCVMYHLNDIDRINVQDTKLRIVVQCFKHIAHPVFHTHRHFLMVAMRKFHEMCTSTTNGYDIKARKLLTPYFQKIWRMYYLE